MICGIDVGSRRVKLVVFDKDAKEKHIFETVKFYSDFVFKNNGTLDVDVEKLGIRRDINKFVLTGYGRNNLEFKISVIISEMKAHVLGAIYEFKLDDFTLLDIGGQDVKVVRVKEKKVRDFLTNDRCAACSGRYLENMAKLLNVSLQELGEHYKNPVRLSTTCAVYGETELIAELSRGKEKQELLAGINNSLFKKIFPMLESLRSDTFIFTGGVAKNKALKYLIESELKTKVLVPKYPEYTGAVGCCLIKV